MQTSLRLSLLVLFPWGFVFGQGADIRGVVTDSSSGERVPFATIMISGTSRGTASNISGFYLVPNVPPGKYLISASSIGYTKQLTSVVVAAGEASVVNFRLSAQPVEFSEVIVTDKARRELTEINTSIHVMEPKDIRIVPVAVQEDIFRSIQILPGVVSTSDVNSHFYVRGGGGDQNLILLDGMKIYNPYHAFGIFSIFDADIVKTTEVYTGAFPPGFGGRLSSVVNMTTRDGRTSGISGKANINFLSSKLLLEGPLTQDTRWLVSGRKSLFSNTLGRFLEKDVPVSFYDAFVKVTREVEESHARYGFEGFYSGDNLKSANLEEPDYSWRNHAVGITGGGLIEDRVFVDVVGYENYFEATRDAKFSKNVSSATTTVSEVGVKANATYYTDSRDLFFFGFEFSFPALEYDLINNVGLPVRLKKSVVETWTWIRYQTTLGNLQLDGGLHVDIGSLFQRDARLEMFQPRVNVSYLFAEGWRAKGSYGHFDQNIITVNNEDDVISIFDAWIAIPGELKSEEADHFVLGVDGNVSPSLSTSFQTYYKYYGSLVSYNRDKIDATDPDYINSIGEAFGFETLIRLGIPFVDFYAAYTYGQTTVNVNGFTFAPRYDRRHTVNLLSDFHLAEALDLTFRWEMGSGFPFTQSVGYYDRLQMDDVLQKPFVGETGKPYARLGTKNGARLPTYHRLDASLTYRFRIDPLRGAVGIHIINVYDHKNIFYFDRTTGQLVNMLSFFPSLTFTLEY